mgnify:CR=1 FL=1
MIDYERYLVRGGTLTETKFQDAYRKALPLFDDVTRYRREESGWEGYEAEFGEEIDTAMMVLIEAVPAIEDARAKAIANDGVASFNNGITSMSFRDSAGCATAAETRARTDAAAVLPLDLVGRSVGC